MDTTDIPIAPDADLITLSEAAKLLGYRNVGSVCNAIDRGTLTAVPLAAPYRGEGQRSRLVRRADVERLRAARAARLRQRLAALGD